MKLFCSHIKSNFCHCQLQILELLRYLKKIIVIKSSGFVVCLRLTKAHSVPEDEESTIVCKYFTLALKKGGGGGGGSLPLRGRFFTFEGGGSSPLRGGRFFTFEGRGSLPLRGRFLTFEGGVFLPLRGRFFTFEGGGVSLPLRGEVLYL